MHPFKIHGDLVEWSPTGYMTIIGVDPGLSGAVAILTHVTDHDKLTEGNNSLDIFDMPVHHLKRGGKNKREIDRYQLARLVEKCCPIDKAIVERVGAMPGQGVSSMFQFGRAVGIIEGILAAMYTSRPSMSHLAHGGLISRFELEKTAVERGLPL